MRYAEMIMENWYYWLRLWLWLHWQRQRRRDFWKCFAEQREKVKEWLLLAVTEAEKELGSGTGQLKLRYVYDLFLRRFPAVAKGYT
ncbi:MAG: hypothetical protein ACLUPD_10785 [Anaerotignum faecicola]